ncbi:preprotein translocase subunit SecE [Isobaculum melis]|uniref:Protein translocase subunit SecE n=1 Tax=Isobaculum melis TaxID=142588 RepID=A0A1H9SG88_9LACT|nr:preprotein translocase subunit SecE [Isobaculum melis]SER83994.1 preprotein translocase subunit SecE [Isobaculum melis]
MGKIFGFFKSVKDEMKQVTWPTGKELRKYTGVVLLTVAFAVAFFFLVDLGITALFNLFL